MLAIFGRSHFYYIFKEQQIRIRIHLDRFHKSSSSKGQPSISCAHKLAFNVSSSSSLKWQHIILVLYLIERGILSAGLWLGQFDFSWKLDTTRVVASSTTSAQLRLRLRSRRTYFCARRCLDGLEFWDRKRMPIRLFRGFRVKQRKKNDFFFAHL